MEFIFEDTEENSIRTPFSAKSTSDDTPMWSSPAQSVQAQAPAVRRKSVPTNTAEVEIAKPAKRRKRKSADVNYLKNVKTPKKKQRQKEKFNWTWNKAGWLVCFCVFLRLIFMDRGVSHYYQMQDTLESKKVELELIKEENAELVKEIHEIKVNPSYQKKVAREHLGVIAQDEYLILFAKDRSSLSI
ncbi:MAG: septum formation initiator family protein [Bacteriovoracaceae bacterium]|nr:septum formation initiator family protein [Bacteriovoracaceae bacterium]